MATFESMDRRMPKIEACLKANGLESLDACNEMLPHILGILLFVVYFVNDIS